MLTIFCYKYLNTLKLFMPTMQWNKGEDEDSDYEEEVYIKQKNIHCITYYRRVVRLQKSIPNNAEHVMITLQLFGVQDEDYLGIKVI